MVNSFGSSQTAADAVVSSEGLFVHSINFKIHLPNVDGLDDLANKIWLHPID